MLKTALAAAQVASEILVSHFHRELHIENKGPKDIVTTADLEAEKAIIAILGDVFPTHRILAEESGANAPTQTGTSEDEYLWLVDPLDGTVNFAQGIPLFAVSIALERNGKVVLGVVALPALGEVFSAERGGGAWLNGQRIATSSRNELGDAIINLGDFNVGSARSAANSTMLSLCASLGSKVRRIKIFSSAALELAYLASGRLDGFIMPSCLAWDIAAGHLLVTEAGGHFSPFPGAQEIYPRTSFVASNTALHDQLLELCHRQ